MQGLHRLVDAPLDDQWHYREGIPVGRLDRTQIRRRWLVQNVINDLTAVTRVADTNPDTEKLAAAEVIDDIA